MLHRRFLLLVVIAFVSTACSGATSPAPSSASAAAVTKPASPAASPSAAPSSSPSPSALAQVQTVQDVKGDAVMTGGEAPGYLDLLEASVELRDGSFVFTHALVSGPPPTPRVPEGAAALGWSFCVDLDPMQSLRGYPMKTVRMPCEVIVHTRWDGKALAGMVFDRRPLADGNAATTTTLAPAADGSSISESVPASVLGVASSFQWSAFTEELGELGTDFVHHVDAAGPATWPAN